LEQSELFWKFWSGMLFVKSMVSFEGGVLINLIILGGEVLINFIIFGASVNYFGNFGVECHLLKIECSESSFAKP
jgi:hypothetical protein